MKILEFIRSNYTRQLKLSDLSRFVTLSERQVQRILSARMGESFRDMLTKERITAAKAMLVSAEGEALALEEVAYRCGYTNYVSFWSQFKRETGFSPKQYKEGCGKT